TKVIEKKGAEFASIKIHNTGINLKMVTAVTKNANLPVTLCSDSACETTFEVLYPLVSPVQRSRVDFEPSNGDLWNYLSVINAIKSHFAKFNNPVVRLAETKPNEA